MFTSSTTRAQGLEILRTCNQNYAVELHTRKVEKMTEAEWIAHRDNLLAPDAARDASIRVMAKKARRA